MILKKLALITGIVVATTTFSGFESASAFSWFNKTEEKTAQVITGVENTSDDAVKYGEKKYNEIGLTPQMGWSSWNFFKEKINEREIIEIADAMEKSGLVEAGYEYLNLDDCWHSSMRDEDGRLQGDLTNFPSGMKELVNQINERGMKVGVYTSNGDFTCEDLPASLGNERIDAETFAEWGIEYFKYDYCHNRQLPNKSPEIDRIYIGKAGQYDSIIIEAEDATLTGEAVVQNNSGSYGGKYVTGLNANKGAIEFEDVYVEEAGEYILTIGLKKSGNFDKFAQVVINGEDAYEAEVPPTSAWNPTGRHQIRVNLKAGNNTIKINNPIESEQDSAKILYERMGNELKKATKKQSEKTGEAEKQIFFSICEWGNNRPWEWGNGTGNSWRTTPDISANWGRIMEIYNKNVQLYEYAGPGAWNDPDMLEVGNGNLSYEQNKSHFTLWCMMAAPLILGNNVREFINEDGTVDTENPTLQIITNKDMIAVDQDIKGVQGRIFKKDGNVDILVKPLDGGELAVCFFNKDAAATTSKVNISDLVSLDYVDLEESEIYKTYELWDKTTERTDNELSASIPGYGVKVYKVSKSSIGEVDKEQSVKLDVNSVVEIGKEITVSTKVRNTGKEEMKNINVSLDLPSSFEVTPVETTKEGLATGEEFIAKWKIVTPNKKGDFNIKTTAEFSYDSEETSQSKEVTSSIRTMAVPEDNSKLGDIEWYSAVSGWGGAVRRNKNIKDMPIVINGKTYTSGMGTHANGETEIFLGGNPYNFKAIIGIDDETNGGAEQWGRPSATFEVLADGKVIYDSGVMKYKDEKEIDLDIAGCQILTLRVTDAGDGNSYDECNWANGVFTKIEVSDTDRDGLKALIDSTNEILASATEGDEVGNYHKGAKNELSKEVEKAIEVFNNLETSIDEVKLSHANLQTAVEKFNSLVITELTGDLNNDGKIGLGDASIVAKYYGDVDESNEKSKEADLNKDGKVDMYEVKFLAKKILK
ncbi:NPCBM/NEW2 domain-containing protein [Clostridium sp.]|uniref:NPCBM/NEW2 domain-containing protein n=1 Tax=Clostridium sp. TaxID=1506 RepID=UPI003F3F6EA8